MSTLYSWAFGLIVFVLLVVSMMTFGMMHAVPGGPFDEFEQPLPPAAKANIMRKYGLDKPVWQQYLTYMGNALRFDFGIPYQQPTSTVTDLISQTWRVSLQLGLMTIIVAFGLGIPIGVYAAYNQNSWIDNVVTFVAMLGITVPNFVIGHLADSDLCRAFGLAADGGMERTRKCCHSGRLLHRLDHAGPGLFACSACRSSRAIHGRACWR